MAGGGQGRDGKQTGGSDDCYTRNMETGGRRRRKLDSNVKKEQLLVGTAFPCESRPVVVLG